METDVIIILGHESNRGKLSKIVRLRIDKGIDIYRKVKAKIIMSGGYSLKHKKDPEDSEAKLMKEYAIKKGVPVEDILIEDKSRDTHGNAYFTKQIIKTNSWKNIAIVTSDFHIIKTQYFFDFVYGRGYNFSYYKIKTDFSKRELEKINKTEKKSIETMKIVYDKNKIKKGDDEKIGKLLKEFYSKF